jgi:DNA-binding winged helix-turn-helix (wHTH) protein/Tol biopolymer transport system component
MPSYRFGPFDFDPQTGRLLKNGTRIRLQRKPQQLLQVLLQHAGEAVTREQLHAHLWPNEAYRDFETGLNVAVKKLRDALCDSADEPVYVSTEIGVGYRFIDAVEEPLTKAKPEKGQLGHPSPYEHTSAPAHTSLGGRFARRVVSLAVVSACLLALLLIYPGFAGRPGSTRHGVHATTRSTFGPPEGWELVTTGDAGGSVALSPDGTKVVYVAGNSKTESILFVRSLDSLSSEAIPGTDGAAMPFWSPDSTHVGFFTDLELKTLELSTLKVSSICDLQRQSPRGGTWGANDIIVFAGATRGPISKVSIPGGKPIPVTSLDHSNFTTHRWPRFLPDGKHFLFLAASHNPDSSSKSAIMLGSVDGRANRFIVESDSDAALVGGALVFSSGGKLLAQAFDPETGVLGLQATVLADNVEVDHSLWRATFDATEQTLIYRPRPVLPELETLKWFQETGSSPKIASKPGIFRGVRASPDGSLIAAICDEPDWNICLVHEDGSLTRINERPLNFGPVWSPDGNSVAFGTHHSRKLFGIAVKDVAGKMPERTVAETEDGIAPTSWSPDGKELLVERTNQRGKRYLAVLQLGDLKFRDLVTSPEDARDGRFSPDGKWIAYYSNENGRDEIYVCTYKDPARKYRISREGGRAARWGPDGLSLFFLAPEDTVLRVQLSMTRNGLLPGTPKTLFRPDILRAPYDVQSFDVLASKRRLLINTMTPQHGSDFVLVTSWRN